VLLVASVTSPGNSTSPALFGTDTEFIVAPKLRRGAPAPVKTENITAKGESAEKAVEAAQPKRVLLRVIASPLDEVAASDPKFVRAYTSRPMFARLSGCSLGDLVASMPDEITSTHDEGTKTFTTNTCIHIRTCILTRVEPPKDPTALSQETAEPERKDPLSLSLAEAASARAKEKEEREKPGFVLACCPDAQVPLPILKDEVRHIELAAVSDGCIAIPRSVLDAGSLGIDVGDLVM
jgi:hypothetical protein